MPPIHVVLTGDLVGVACLRARRTGLDPRVALGFGTIQKLGRRQAGLADAAGEAFQFSGRALDGMPRQRRIALAGPGVVQSRLSGAGWDAIHRAASVVQAHDWTERSPDHG